MISKLNVENTEYLVGIREEEKNKRVIGVPLIFINIIFDSRREFKLLGTIATNDVEVKNRSRLQAQNACS